MAKTIRSRQAASPDPAPSENSTAATEHRWELFAFGGFGGFLIALFVGVITVAWATTGMDDATARSGGSNSVSLFEGERIYATQCAQCHGPNGEGGIGVRLGDGAVTESFPDIASQIAVITNGRGNMPSFENTLSPAEIESVARYERESLGG